MTKPTAEQLRLASECADTLASRVDGFDMGGKDHDVWVAWREGAALAIQATEARMAAAVEAERERCARICENHADSESDNYSVNTIPLRQASLMIRSQSNG